MQFGRYHRLELRQLPSKFGGVWLSTSKVINAKHWANVVTTPADRFSLISQSILNRFLCNFAGTTSNYSGDCPEKFVKFERVFLKLLVRLVVNLLEYFKCIHLDVNSDINSQPFTTWFCRHRWMVLRRLPCKLCKVWENTSKVINEISVKFDLVFQKLFI